MMIGELVCTLIDNVIHPLSEINYYFQCAPFVDVKLECIFSFTALTHARYVGIAVTHLSFFRLYLLFVSLTD